MNILEESQLLKQSKDQLVEVLQNHGFAVTADTPLADVAKYMKWDGGLLDLRVATLRKTNGEYNAYSQEEWEAMSASEKASLVKLGIQIRAERQQFIISKDNVLSDSDTTSLPWGPTSSDVRNLYNYGEGTTGQINDIDGEANTDLIIAYGIANSQSFHAAERARAYKASTFADGGYEDPTKWSLPAIGQLWLLYKYRPQINTILTYFFGSNQLIVSDWYWSSTEYSSANAWVVHMNYGFVSNGNKNSTYRVRAVAPVPGAAGLPSLAI